MGICKKATISSQFDYCSDKRRSINYQPVIDIMRLVVYTMMVMGLVHVHNYFLYTKYMNIAKALLVAKKVDEM